MAGDEIKRSEARTEPEAGSGDDAVPAGEPTIQASPATEDAASSEHDATVEDAGNANEGAGIEAPAPAVPGPSSNPDSRARVSFLSRLVPYLVVFAIGALVSIGAAFILNLLAGPPDSRGEIEQRFAALDERATALERKQEREGTMLGALADRFGMAETEIRQAITAVHEVEKVLADRPTGATSAAEATSPDLGPLASRLEAIEQKLEQDKAALGSVAGATTAAGPDIARIHATAIVAGRLVQEIERGEPYVHEVTALQALGVDDSELAPLQTFAATGVASLRRLSEEFARLAPAILTTERKSEHDSLVERLKGYAANLVHIEQMNDLESKDVHGLVARIKFALAHDHVADAYKLWNELPDDAKASSEHFGTAAKDRLDALAAARSIESGAVAALSKPKS